MPELKQLFCTRCNRYGTIKTIFRSSQNKYCIDCTLKKRVCKMCGEEKVVLNDFNSHRNVNCKACNTGNVIYVDGLKRCSRCEEFIDLSLFNKKSSACKKCLSEYHKKRYVPQNNRVLKKRVCIGCKESKTIKHGFNHTAKHCKECVGKGVHLEYVAEYHKKNNPKKVHRDDIQYITCTKCGKYKHKTGFEFLKKMKRRSQCKECRLPQKRLQKKRYHEKHKNDPEYRLRRKAGKHIYRKRKKYTSDGTVTAKFLRELEALTKECPMCSCKLEKYDIDHVIPLSKGGKHTSSNIQLLCPPCNNLKSDKILTLV